ncbi:MAG TPA: PASTA domain-containing protein, partial [Mycobacteriales bacterium]|nr:PASTA domain-containing protein [Mycobacteriales bacterium]
ILNSAGKVFKNYPEHCSRVLSKYTADTINDILKGLMKPGGFGQYLTLDKPSAGKTGTIDNNMTVWFDGYTPALAAASMIAGANQQGHWISLNGQVVGGQYVATAHGSTTAGPMWADAMRRIQDLLPNKDFVPPSRDIRPNQQAAGAGQVTVPSVTGMSVSSAMSMLSGTGLSPQQAETVPSSLPKGSVVSTNPSPGSNVPRGTTVYVYTSGG